jgi:hypothetical protein
LQQGAFANPRTTADTDIDGFSAVARFEYAQ